MEEIFQRLIANHFSDLKGTSVSASVPVPEYLINDIVGAALEGNKTISSCQISLYSQNHVDVSLKTKLLPWVLLLKLKLDRSVDFASFGSPKIRAWLENNRLLGSLGSFFNILPEGIKLYGNQVVLDLGTFLPTSEQKRLLQLIKSVDIQTEEGRAIFDIKAEVD